MQTKLINYGLSDTAVLPGTSEARRKTDWSRLSNQGLKFTFDLLSLHQSPFEVEAMNEIQKRILAGSWLNLDNPPPPSYTINFKGFLPYLGVILAVLAGVLLVGRWLIGG